MRKQITILGVGPRKSGTSKKTGRPYDMTDVSISYYDPNYNGDHAETIALSAEVLEHRIPQPGDVWDVEMYYANFQTRIACIYSV